MTTQADALTAIFGTISFLRDLTDRCHAAALPINPKGNLMGQLEEATRKLEANAGLYAVAPPADEYQGWCNRETWCAALWLGNEQGHYEAARSIATGDGTKHEKANAMAELVANLIDNASMTLAGRNGHGDRMAADMATTATARVDWLALVAHFGEA